MRDKLIFLHRWLALATSVVVIVIAITGSALVFEGAIDRALNPSLWRVSPGTNALPFDTIVAHATAAVPTQAVAGFSPPRSATQAAVVTVGPMQVFVDPYTGAVQGTRDLREFQKTLPRRLHVLHTSLLAGERGGTLVAVVTIVTLILALSGIVLWWPDKLFRITWSASWKRVNFDLHHVLGIATALVLAIIAASGVIIHYDTLSRVIGRLDRAPRLATPVQSASVPGAAPRSLDAMLASAREALPGANIMFVNIGPRPEQPVLVAMRFPEDRTPGGRSRVFIDRNSGAVLRAESTREAQPGTKINNVMRSVHTGDLFGNPTRAVWLLVSVVLASQVVTGALMWWNARRKSPRTS